MLGRLLNDVVLMNDRIVIVFSCIQILGLRVALR